MTNRHGNTKRSTFFSKALVTCAIVLLAACGSSGSSTDVAADFSVNGVKGSVSGQNVTIDLTSKEACSTLNNLVVGIQASGAAISPDPTVARDYSKPVDFTITTPDGTKTVYTVTVKGNTCANAPAPVTPVVPVTPVTPVTIVTPTDCAAAAIGSTGYSLVFKGCSAANVAEYYDKTECVRDNVTRLIWQGQTAAGTGLRANDQFKSNFDSTINQQKFDATVGGGYRAPTQAEVDASSNSIGFKNNVNATNLCGSAAWRIPTQDELLGITKTNPSSPMIDADWFPNTPQSLHYWSASPYANNDTFAWYVDFGFYNFSNYDDRANYSPVRLVLCNTSRCMPG